MRPEDIKNRTFANALRGYDKDEVRSFLFRVAESSRELHEQLTATEAQLAASAADQQAAEVATDWDVPGAALPTDVPATVVDGDVLSSGDLSHDAAATPGVDTAEAAGVVEAEAPETFDAGTVDGAFGAPVAAEPVPAAEAFVEAPTEALAVAEQSIADRYGAIGDRIADLLRNADDSAAEILTRAEHDSAATRAAAEAEALQVRTDAEEHASQLLAEAQSIRAEADTYRDEVMADLANARLEQETALNDARLAAESEVETFRVDSIEEITGLRSDAFVEIDELRSGANTEVEELRTVAQADTEALRASVLADATASIAGDEANAAQAREEAEADRIAARAELDDVRTEVSTLLEQARTQSEFIKQEADEIIRTKVRANFEQAQTRIDVLRNTEVASRERIVLAQTELASALTRLDAEPMPELDPTASPAVIEEAERRHDEIAGSLPAVETSEAAGEYQAEVVDVEESAPAFVETDVVDTDVVDTDIADVPEDDSLSSYFGAVPADVETQTTGDILSGSFDDPDDLSTADAPVSAETFIDAADSDIADLETDDIDEYADAVEVDDSGWAVSEVESVGYEASNVDDVDVPEFETTEYEVTSVDGVDVGSSSEPTLVDQAPVEFADLDDTEHVVIESAEYGDLPVRGDSSSPVRSFSDGGSFSNDDLTGGDDLPVRSQPAAESYTPTESYGAASLAEALPMEPEAPELGGATQEDALARLVREAMQEAVDSARKND